MITQQGVKQEELPPATMNGFQRFFNKFGFFKEAASKVEEYNSVMKGRQNVQENYKTDHLDDPRTYSTALRNNLFEAVCDTSENFKQNSFPGRDGKASPYRTTRTAPQSLAFATLLSEGHSMEDILNPYKLGAEKDRFAQEYVDHAEQCDSVWFYDHSMKGLAAISDYMTEKMSQTDLSNKEAVTQLVSELAYYNTVLQDLTQEKDVLVQNFGDELAQ
ncbi:hypothetical protein RFF05_12325 [Bengtsoniella intestinalis]|uniref:hypothetical protein n=1 Tax=Bengtsoniella intestinalis TaxID=3073143 RepID=UPI00391F94A4